ncbi:MAG: 3-dehydroquinate synthase [Dehalogenimonas sp.]|uniref:3-dehydroquinate synthase n=1 Tax=Candidatus Dehalogenimonas loeffleri TaxID=3127115 RepID=A0ABZ2J1G9_9CHLR|nr:3-dehydroquinate synthase [Dehalogenimonas sp.]
MTYQIHVNLKERSYPVCIGEGVLGQTGDLLAERNSSGRVVVITNPTVGRLYAAGLTETLTSSGFEPEVITVPDGEASKSLTTAGKLYESLARRKVERTTPILALGGGVIGDLTGFVAATYQRGVPFVQIPTTLLAQVDSGIGGKVAVNVGRLKNMAGAFYQPRLVASDTTTLLTLPLKEIRNGMAEVIKSAVIHDPVLFAFLEANMPVLLNRDVKTLTYAVHRAAEVKVNVVEQDEGDRGLRHILNFGHTFGHAVESVSNFKVGHGTAVAIGMAAASRMAYRLGMLSGNDLERILKVIMAAGLPVSMVAKNASPALMRAMLHDKKIDNGKLKFILPTGIGTVTARTDVNPEIIAEVLR